MDQMKDEFIKVEITCDVTDESESKGLLNRLRQDKFDQESIKIDLPKIRYIGKFKGSFNDCLEECKTLNEDWKVRQLIVSSPNS